jgi:hypothetical protein
MSFRDKARDKLHRFADGTSWGRLGHGGFGESFTTPAELEAMAKEDVAATEGLEQDRQRQEELGVAALLAALNDENVVVRSSSRRLTRLRSRSG